MGGWKEVNGGRGWGVNWWNLYEFRCCILNNLGLLNVLIFIKCFDFLIFDIKKLFDCLVDNIGLIDYFK